MSTWRVVWPGEEDEPAIIPFPRLRQGVSCGVPPLGRSGRVVVAEPPAPPQEELCSSTGGMSVVERARLLFANRRCFACGYPVVLPIERDDAVLNKCGQPIPGTATLEGFRCEGCHAEWSV